MPAVHPLLRLVVERPHLLAEHVSAYAVVLAEEGVLAASQWRRRFLWQAIAGAFAALALTLAGVAAMLWVALPRSTPEVAWVFVAVPALALLASVAAALVALRAGTGVAFAGLRRHAAADLALIRESRPMHAP